MKAAEGKKVKVHYTGKLDDGTIFDSSEGKEPISFEVGKHQVIPGFEKAVVGMALNEEKEILIKKDEAYGSYKKELVQEIPKTNFPSNITASKGMVVQLKNEQGQTILAKITDVSDSSITFDFNHPLAGKELHFEIRLVEVA